MALSVWVHGKRVLRLIINLVPTNALQRQLKGESRRMGYPGLRPGLWPRRVLYGDEAMTFYSEDQKLCFHMYRVPAAWRGYVLRPGKVGFARRVRPSGRASDPRSGHCVSDGVDQCGRLHSRGAREAFLQNRLWEGRISRARFRANGSDSSKPGLVHPAKLVLL